MDQQLLHLCLDYTRFNAARTMSTARPSEFTTIAKGEALALLDLARPQAALFNRVLGFQESTIDQLPGILELYESSGASPQFDVATEHLSPPVCEALMAAGFRPVEGLAYLIARNCVAQPSGLPVEVWPHDQADRFLELLKTSGVQCDPEVWEVRREFYCTDTFRAYVAILDGQPRAWGTLYVSPHGGYLANAFTQPEFRGRGCQTALLAARVADAAELGLDFLATDIVPETISHRNIRRAGFEIATLHTHWQRAAE